MSLLFWSQNLQPAPSPLLGGGTVTAAVFRDRVLRRLNETAGSVAGDLPDDGGGDPVWTTDQAIDDYATEAVALLCRTCWPLFGSFSYTLPIGGSRFVPYGAMSPASDAPAGAVLWQPLRDGVLWQPAAGQSSTVPVRLRFITEPALSLRYRDYLTLSPAAWSQAVTYYWYPLGANGFGIYPPLLPGNGTLAVRGLAVHPPAHGQDSVSAYFPYIPDDLLAAVEFYVCWALASKNQDDPILAPRAGLWGAEWEKRRQQLYERLDPMLAAYFPPLQATQITAGQAAAAAAASAGPGGGQ